MRRKIEKVMKREWWGGERMSSMELGMSVGEEVEEGIVNRGRRRSDK